MPRTRDKAARDVAIAFMPAKKAVDAAARAAAHCITVALEARAEARVKSDVGVAALAKLSEAAQLMLRANQMMIEAHPMLAELPKEVGVVPWFGPSPCVPNEPGGHLRAVGE